MVPTVPCETRNLIRGRAGDDRPISECLRWGEKWARTDAARSQDDFGVALCSKTLRPGPMARESNLCGLAAHHLWHAQVGLRRRPLCGVDEDGDEGDYEDEEDDKDEGKGEA